MEGPLTVSSLLIPSVLNVERHSWPMVDLGEFSSDRQDRALSGRCETIKKKICLKNGKLRKLDRLYDFYGDKTLHLSDRYADHAVLVFGLFGIWPMLQRLRLGKIPLFRTILIAIFHHRDCPNFGNTSLAQNRINKEVAYGNCWIERAHFCRAESVFHSDRLWRCDNLCCFPHTGIADISARNCFTKVRLKFQTWFCLSTRQVYPHSCR